MNSLIVKLKSIDLCIFPVSYLIDSVMGFVTSFFVLRFVMFLYEKYFSVRRLYAVRA